MIDRRVTYTVYAKVWRGIDSGHFARESNVIYRELVLLCLLVFVYILYIFWTENTGEEKEVGTNSMNMGEANIDDCRDIEPPEGGIKT